MRMQNKPRKRVLLVTYIFFQQRLAKCVLGNYQLQPWLCFGENWISQSTASISTAFCTDIRGPLMNSDFHPALPTFQIWFVRKAAQSFKSVATSSGSGSTHFFFNKFCWMLNTNYSYVNIFWPTVLRQEAAGEVAHIRQLKLQLHSLKVCVSACVWVHNIHNSAHRESLTIICGWN